MSSPLPHLIPPHLTFPYLVFLLPPNLVCIPFPFTLYSTSFFYIISLFHYLASTFPYLIPPDLACPFLVPVLPPFRYLAFPLYSTFLTLLDYSTICLAFSQPYSTFPCLFHSPRFVTSSTFSSISHYSSLPLHPLFNFLALFHSSILYLTPSSTSHSSILPPPFQNLPLSFLFTSYYSTLLFFTLLHPFHFSLPLLPQKRSTHFNSTSIFYIHCIYFVPFFHLKFPCILRF